MKTPLPLIIKVAVFLLITASPFVWSENGDGFSYQPATGWSKTYGGTQLDWAYSVIQTADGGYAIAGLTQSFGVGGTDSWLVKTDVNGNMLWNRTYGGTGSDVTYSFLQTVDRGYVLAGSTSSFGAGMGDFWLIKTDANGNIQWSKTYGGTDWDEAWSVIQTSDGGYALAGCTRSFGAGEYDFWLVKTDANGNMQWNKTYGGTKSDWAYHVLQTDSKDYVLAGCTSSFGAGWGDVWLIRTDTSGNIKWTKTYGGTEGDTGWSVVKTVDGGYAIAGDTRNYHNNDSFDFWLVKTYANGNMQWNKTYGGANDDVACSVLQTSDGGYALAGYTLSFGAGSFDFWLVKTDEFGIVPEVPPTDTTPPAISIQSPENKSYPVNDVPLTFTINESTSWIGYSLDGQMNSTISSNYTLLGLSDGGHTITVYANDTAGNMGCSDTVYFTVDTVPPTVWILSPENRTYTNSHVFLSFTVDEAISWIGYDLNGQANVTIDGNTTISDLSDGSHSLIVYAKDTAGNAGASEITYFSIYTQQPESFPTWIVAVIVIIAALGTAVYLIKIRKRS